MKRFERILFYLSNQKKNIVLYVVFNLLSILFSLVSLAMLSPILKLLFTDKKEEIVKPEMSFSVEGLKNLVDYFKYYYNELIAREGAIYALGTICVVIT